MSTDGSEVSAASIAALMMEAARTSETSVDIQLRTWQYIPEHSELNPTISFCNFRQHPLVIKHFFYHS
jgi:hypothetical protein